METASILLLIENTKTRSLLKRTISSCITAKIEVYKEDLDSKNDQVVTKKPDFFFVGLPYLVSGNTRSFARLSENSVIIAVKESIQHPDNDSTIYKTYPIDCVIDAQISKDRLQALLKLLMLVKKNEVLNLEFSVPDLIKTNDDNIWHKNLIINLFNHTNEGMCYWDIGTDRIIMSHLFKNSLGYDDRTLPDKIGSFTSLIHPEDKILFRKAIVEYFDRGKGSFSVELRLHCADKSYRWMLYRGFGTTNKEGKPTELIFTQSDIDDMKAMIFKFENMALYDSLTNLPNLLYDRLVRDIAISERNKKLLGLIFIDLNKFKAINDKYGHRVGDMVLVETARRLLAAVRKIDSVARLSGDEFVIITPNLTTEKDIKIVVNRIETEFSKPMFIEKGELFVSCSIGFSFYPKDGNDIESLLEKADMAMYKRKNVLQKLAESE